MTGTRYLVVAGATDDFQAIVRRLIVGNGVQIVRDRPGLIAWSSTGAPLLQPDPGITIFGPLFQRGRGDRLAEITPDQSRAIAGSAGQQLIDRYWGPYVAILDAGKVTAIRAPFGDLPCLFAPIERGIALASDLALLCRLPGFNATIDWNGVARHLVAADVRGGATCLDRVSELRGGNRLIVNDNRCHVETLWSPWPFVTEAKQFDDTDASNRLRGAVRHCVEARASEAVTSLLLVSGGLDSSIVAASLADSGRPAQCLTIATHDPSGDERPFARALCDHLGLTLHERSHDWRQVDLRLSLSRHQPRPTSRSFEQDAERISLEVALATGAGAVVDGGGGDNVFCALQSVAPAADCLLGGRPDRFWPIARTIAQLADTNLGKVAWRAWRRSRRIDRRYRWPVDHRYLGVEAIRLAEDAATHPWLNAPQDILPGKAAHVALLIPAQALVEDRSPVSAFKSVSPLVSQPVVETCLMIPSWYWYARGRNRAAARLAFAPLLLPRIAWRGSKGTPDSFIIELFEHHRALVRTLLLDGLLAERGLIDRAALARAVDDPRPVHGHEFNRIMQLVDVEVWARAWAGP